MDIHGYPLLIMDLPIPLGWSPRCVSGQMIGTLQRSRRRNRWVGTMLPAVQLLKVAGKQPGCELVNVDVHAE